MEMRRGEGIKIQSGYSFSEWVVGQMRRKRDKGRNKEDIHHGLSR